MEFSYELAQAVDRMGVAASCHRQAKLAGHVHGELVLPVRRAAIGDLYGVGQLEHRMAESVFGRFGQLVGHGLVDEGPVASAIAAQRSPERVGGDDKAAGGGGGFTQLCGFVETGLVAVQSEGQHMPEVGFHLHSPDQDDTMQSGELLKLVPVPRPRVLCDAEAPQAQAVRFQHQVLGGQAAVAAAFGGVYMKIEKSGHETCRARSSWA